MKTHTLIRLASFLFILISSVWSTTYAEPTTLHKVWTIENLKPGKNNITFKSRGKTLAAHLYTPKDFDTKGSYPAIVFSSAFNQVKEQTGAVYAPPLAERGYVTIVFDHIGYGDSEGELRNNENSFIKIESIRDATSFIGTLPFVDRAKLFGLGVCASGGYMALAATTDKCLKAIASVSGMLGNKASYFKTMDRKTVVAMITAANAGRQKAYETGKVDYQEPHYVLSWRLSIVEELCWLSDDANLQVVFPRILREYPIAKFVNSSNLRAEVYGSNAGSRTVYTQL